MNIEQGKIVRRYFYEYVVVALCVAVTTLFYFYHDLTKFVQEDLMNSNKTMQQVIQRNTDAINEKIKIK